MSDKVYYPETISDQPLPSAGSETVYPTTTSESAGTGGVYKPTKLSDERPFPEKLISFEVRSAAFDTQERRIKGNFTFSTLGAIQIGEYVNGVSGDVRISPNGIVARNVNGDTTVSIDGTTGDATFLGTLQAGTVIAGALEVGDPNVVIDGENARILVNDGVTDRILIGYQENGF